MKPMSTAPLDRRILIKTEIWHFTEASIDELKKKYPGRSHFSSRYRKLHEDWYKVGEYWVECWWNADYIGSKKVFGGFEQVRGQWEVWCGSKRSHSTESIKPLGWAEVPREDLEVDRSGDQAS